MFGSKSRRDDARRRLLEDIDRAHGYMVVIIEVARRLKIDVPGAIVVCSDNLSGWHRALARRTLDPALDLERTAAT